MSTATAEEPTATSAKQSKAAAPSGGAAATVATEIAKVQQVKTEMGAELYERDDEIGLLVLSTIAQQHGLLIGAGGVAKSMATRMLMSHFEGKLYEVLLRKSLPVEQLVGPVSLKGLENDVFTHVTAGKLPEANLALLDEIFKANAVVLNALLGILNERIFHNDGQATKVPLWAAIGASNELPTESELAAFRDRFAWTKIVQPVSTDENFIKVLRGGLDRNAGKITQPTVVKQAELAALQQACRQVDVPQDVLADVAKMKSRAESEGLFISARRYLAGLELCRAQALINGRDAVISDDLVLYQHTLWTDEEDRAKAYELTLDYAGKLTRATQKLRGDFEPYRQEMAAIRQALSDPSFTMTQEISAQVMTVTVSLRKLEEQVTKTVADAKGEGRDTTELDNLLRDIAEERRYVREDVLG